MSFLWQNRVLLYYLKKNKSTKYLTNKCVLLHYYFKNRSVFFSTCNIFSKYRHLSSIQITFCLQINLFLKSKTVNYNKSSHLLFLDQLHYFKKNHFNSVQS